ncbi:MAG: replication and repair protein RecN [Bacteroidota bacterium]|jgi:DNA repair protein RecN (Recombination protein N)|nr:replication and repair protein RecN [Bacteroidota bacterium]
MLKHLSVQNYALIDKLDVDLKDGLTIITGETGAGKSILLGALGLIAGSRADTQSLQDKTRKCIIEAEFNIKGYSLKDFFKEHELDFEEVTTIRREINPEGKSRAFINDTPVTLNQLKELGERLIDIHSQHQTLSLNGSDFQLSVVDAYAKHESLLEEYHNDFRSFKSLEIQLNELVEKEAQAKKDLDYFQFQFNELEDAGLKTGEQSSMEQELETLNNAEDIKSNLSKAFSSLNGGEQNLLSSLNEIKALLNSMAKFKPEIAELSARLNSSYIELKDISNEIESLEQEVVYDPKQIDILNEKLDAIYRLQQKHQVKTIEELIAIKDELSNKLLDFSSLENEIEKTKAALDKVNKALSTKAKTISDNRKKVIPKIEKEIASLLSSLSMPNAQLQITQTIGETFSATGIDKISFLFSANKGSDFKELNKVASGGELSRLMLSIKSLIAQLTALPTIIFDEIDTGVSGDVADKVGTIMNAMSAKMQVITITHLPQIASKGQSHLFVYKEDKNNKTYSNIKKLNSEERIQEVAKMLSTGTPTAAAISNAKELLNQ